MSVVTLCYSQTCCSGGVPIAANLGFQTSNQGVMLVSITYDRNTLNTLYDNSEELISNNRQRITDSYLLRMAYGLTDRLNIETLIPYINQKRNITTNLGHINREQSQGIGDIVLLPKYDIIQSNFFNVNVGIGIKLSSGSSTKTNAQGLLLINDLQPGSGATDVLTRLAIDYIPSFRPSMTTYFSSILSRKGTDEDYLITQTYRFGNDLQVMTGINDQFSINEKTLYLGLGLRYRKANHDLINNADLPNTGGQWLFTNANFGFSLSQRIRFISKIELPIYTQVDGTQLSPTTIFNLGIFGKISIFDNSPQSIEI